MEQTEFPYARFFNIGVEIDKGLNRIDTLEKSYDEHASSLNWNRTMFKSGLSGILALTTWHYLGGDISGTMKYGVSEGASFFDLLNSSFIGGLGSFSVFAFLLGGTFYKESKMKTDPIKGSINRLIGELEEMVDEKDKLYERHFLDK